MATQLNNLPTSEPKPDNLQSVLPGVAQRKHCDIVIYDGQCNFCRGQVQRLHRWDSGKLAYVSLHDPLVAERYPELSFDMLMEQMYVITNSGKIFGGADAFRYLSRKLPWLWILAPAMHFPGSLPVWRYLYRQVAKRRYRIAGKTQNCENGSCRLPS